MACFDSDFKTTTGTPTVSSVPEKRTRALSEKMLFISPFSFLLPSPSVQSFSPRFFCMRFLGLPQLHSLAAGQLLTCCNGLTS